AGGVKSINLAQNYHRNSSRAKNANLLGLHAYAYMPMIDTAETVAKRYHISRERQDEYALESQRRTAAAQREGRLKDEIVPLESVMLVQDKASGEFSKKPVRLEQDEGN